VILACWNVTKARQAADDIISRLDDGRNVKVMELDLSSLVSVRKFADDFLRGLFWNCSYTIMHLLLIRLSQRSEVPSPYIHVPLIDCSSSHAPLTVVSFIPPLTVVSFMPLTSMYH
jgi:hypothetical protein